MEATVSAKIRSHVQMAKKEMHLDSVPVMVGAVEAVAEDRPAAAEHSVHQHAIAQQIQQQIQMDNVSATLVMFSMLREPDVFRLQHVLAGKLLEEAVRAVRQMYSDLTAARVLRVGLMTEMGIASLNILLPILTYNK
jgi:hypothetical protein